MPDLDTVLTWRGRTVIDRDGDKAGTLGALYRDEHDRPAYAGVMTGLFRRHESMVPLADARGRARNDSEASAAHGGNAPLCREEAGRSLKQS
jgi:hypothetical protein